MEDEVEDNVNTAAANELRSYIERIERLEEEKQTYVDDIKEVYAEAKGTGFCTKTMRSIVKRRKKDRAELEEEENMLELYETTLGTK